MDITTLALVTALNGPIKTYEVNEPKPQKLELKPIVITKVVRVSAAEVRENPIPTTGGAQGGAGYILPGTNCVACANQLTGRAQNGNAGSHVPTHSDPRVGDIMVWYPGEQGAGFAGHVGVVQGINPDGSVNIAHCNWGGGQTTFQSTGKFY